MKSVSSISGGKTSAMMALKFPTDYNIFAVVLTKHKKSAPKDKGLLRECQKRIPYFIASHEADLTLVNILKLEQELGKEIKWIASEFTMDDFILGETDYPGYRKGSVMLPNQKRRFCTQNLKVLPIFWHCYLNYFDLNNQSPLLMNIGFRWDEPRRLDKWNCDNEKERFPYACSITSKKYQWKVQPWMIGRFPMYENGITKQEVIRYWENKKWTFPEISNCRFCFHHSSFKMGLQAKLEPENLEWWLDMEKKTGQHFSIEGTLIETLNQPLLPLDVFEQSTCHCTD